jgi:hypothetical protein
VGGAESSEPRKAIKNRGFPSFSPRLCGRDRERADNHGRGQHAFAALLSQQKGSKPNTGRESMASGGWVISLGGRILSTEPSIG